MDESTKSILSAFVFVTGMAIFGTWLWFQIDGAVDYNIIHVQIMTNQTYVDEMPCEKITTTRKLLSQLYSPTQQDEVEQLKIDFKELDELKHCS